jgi:hypothetical protein
MSQETRTRLPLWLANSYGGESLSLRLALPVAQLRMAPRKMAQRDGSLSAGVFPGRQTNEVAVTEDEILAELNEKAAPHGRRQGEEKAIEITTDWQQPR